MTGVELTSVLAILVALIGATIDTRTGHIPNWLTIPALASAPFVAFVQHDARAALVSVAGALLCALGPLLFFFRGGLGGGDVKLLAALGALLGPTLGISAEYYGFLAAALFVPARLAWQGRLLATLADTARLLANPLRPKAARAPMPEGLRMRLRLGPAFCAGTIVAIALARIS